MALSTWRLPWCGMRGEGVVGVSGAAPPGGVGAVGVGVDPGAGQARATESARQTIAAGTTRLEARVQRNAADGTSLVATERGSFRLDTGGAETRPGQKIVLELRAMPRQGQAVPVTVRGLDASRPQAGIAGQLALEVAGAADDSVDAATGRTATGRLVADKAGVAGKVTVQLLAPGIGPAGATAAQAGGSLQGTLLRAGAQPLIGLAGATLTLETLPLDLPEGTGLALRLLDPAPPQGTSGKVALDAAIGLLRGTASLPQPQLPADEGLGSALRDLATRLLADAGDEAGPRGAATARAENEPAAPEQRSAEAGWRGVPAALQETGRQPMPLGLFMPKDGAAGGGAEEEKTRRMTLTLELSRLGRVRLDLIHKGRRLDGILSLAHPPDRATRLELAGLFGAGLELAGLDGRLVLRTDRAGPPPPPVEEGLWA